MRQPGILRAGHGQHRPAAGVTIGGKVVTGQDRHTATPCRFAVSQPSDKGPDGGFRAFRMGKIMSNIRQVQVQILPRQAIALFGDCQRNHRQLGVGDLRKQGLYAVAPRMEGLDDRADLAL